MGEASVWIEAPDSAKEGSTVDVLVNVLNLNVFTPFFFKTEIFVDADRIFTKEETIDVFPYSKEYSVSFIMGSYDVVVLAWVERWVIDWEYDCSDSKAVSLELVPEFAGSITRKELDYDAVRVPFPVQ